MRLAYFSPLNPQPSGISDYSEELLPHLAAHAELDLFVDGFTPSNRDLTARFRVFDYSRDPSALALLDRYDVAIYHFGNDHRYHAGMLDAMRRHPGVVVLHDFALQDFFLGLARERGDLNIYLDELAACHGWQERSMAEEFLNRGSDPPHVAAPLMFPLNCRLARAAEGLIVHSEWNRARLAEAAPGVPVTRINMPVKPLGDASGLLRERGRRKAQGDEISIATFGLIMHGKGVERTLRALSALRDRFAFRYTLVGSPVNFPGLRELIERHDLGDHVTITGHVPLEEFERRIAETDIAINLRERTVGETSASLCRIMAAGVAAIVADAGWYSELPNDCVVKINLKADTDTLLQAYLERLMKDAHLRGRIGENARRYVRAEHDIERAAARYVEFISETLPRIKKGRRMFSTPDAVSPSHDAAARQALPRAEDGDSETSASPDGAGSETTAHDLKIRRAASPRRLSLAYFSPLNPQPSGISDYSEELLPHLAAHAELDLFVDGFTPSNRDLTVRFRLFDYRRDPSALARLDRYDAVVYHMGNDHRYHAGILAASAAHPGVVVLHDFALQDFFLGLARERDDRRIYLDEVAACHGAEARRAAADALAGGKTPPMAIFPIEFPLNYRIARAAEGIIVHSEWNRARLAETAPGVPIARINHHITERAAAAPPANGARGGAAGVVNLASFGLITPDKGIESTLRALSALRDRFAFRYTLVGSPVNFKGLRELIERHGLGDLVKVTGHVSLEEFERRIAETDIAINLRERQVGATSGSLCRIMASGVAAIVSNAGWFAELPDSCVVKIDHDESADALLLAYLSRLIEDADLRRRIGANARRHVLAEHRIERSAARYIEFIHEVIEGRARRRLVGGVTTEMRRLGARPSDESFMREVAAEVAALVPARAFEARAESHPNGHGTVELEHSAPTVSIHAQGRTPKLEGVDYKRAAREYLGRLNDERRHHLRTKPFYNLAHKPSKYKNEGLDEDSHRHFCDFANMAVALALPSGARILDVGCGSGWLSEYFARLGYEVKGIDISPALVEMSRERVARVPYPVDHETPLRCAFEVHDVEIAPLDEKFDAIICYDSLHHFEDERAVFRHLARMLDVGGQLFILEGERPPAASSSEEELRGVMQEFGTLESPFDPDYLRALLDENGFAVVGDYVSVNGLFERVALEADRLPLTNVATNYHYLICKKVADDAPASTVPDSRHPGDLRARVALLDPLPESFSPGVKIAARLAVTNTGDTLWLTGQTVRAGLVMPALRIFDETGHVVSERHGPLLARAVAPGETVTLKVTCQAPPRTGAYMLKVDLVDQHVCWFEERGSVPLMLKFEVE